MAGASEDVPYCSRARRDEREIEGELAGLIVKTGRECAQKPFD